jgi:tetratricopeptide (TPR) repeat protein
MENNNNHAGENYYSNLNRLLRYFARKQSGFAFACFANYKIVSNINSQLIGLLAEMQIEVAVINLQPQSGLYFMQQLMQSPADALIINNLGDWISQSNQQNEQGNSGFLQEINFAREELLAIGKPILFWTNHKTTGIISNQAADLYTQRSINTVYFDDISGTPVVTTEVKGVFGTQFTTTEEFEAIELKIKLLKKQLQDAEQLNYPKNQVAVNLVIPLAKAYSEIDLHNEAFGLIHKYNDNFDKQNAGTLASLGDIYFKGKQYHRAIEILNDALAIAVSKKDLKQRSSINLQLGDVYTETGNLPQALACFDECYRLSSELLKILPQNADYKNNLGRAFSRLGKTHSALGNLEKALKYFEMRSELGKELHEVFPQNVSFKNGLAISYSKVGETHAALGNLEKALKYFEQDLELIKELTESFPQNVSFKNGLAISYSKLGDTHFALGNLEKALKYFEMRSQLGKELHEAFPKNVDFKNGLAISYQNLGNTHSTLGNLEKALKFYERRSELGKELHEAFPQKVSFKNGLAVSYSKLGETHSALGNLEKALKYYEKDFELTKELYEAFPQNVSFKNGLAISYAKLGVFNRDKMNNKTLARQYFVQAQNLLEELALAAPQYADFLKNLLGVKSDLAGL